MKKVRLDKKAVVRTGSGPTVKRVVSTKPIDKQTSPKPKVTGPVKENTTNLPANVLNSQHMTLNAQRELEIARRLRMQAQRYLQETEMKARSEAQRLILQTRMTIRKEIEEFVNQANEEIQKVLADIRVIRITAQEELAAQKKFTDAARLRSFTLALQEEEQAPKPKTRKRTTAKKAAVN